MKITYHTPKHEKTQQERGLSFEEVVDLVWEKALVAIDDRKDYGELRYNAFLPDSQGQFYSVTFTWREDVMRIISFRRARTKERKRYESKIRSPKI
ncbi:MAG: BrnT family toxin [Alphaproteobacteria bacterium]